MAKQQQGFLATLFPVAKQLSKEQKTKKEKPTVKYKKSKAK